MSEYEKVKSLLLDYHKHYGKDPIKWKPLVERANNFIKSCSKMPGMTAMNQMAEIATLLKGLSESTIKFILNNDRHSIKDAYRGYIAKVVAEMISHSEIYRAIEDYDGFVKNIQKELKRKKGTSRKVSLKHRFFRKINGVKSKETYNLKKTNPAQVFRIYIFLESLKCRGTRNHIGEALRNDIADKFSEHGGLILINPHQNYLDQPIIFHHLVSVRAKERNYDNNGNYARPGIDESVEGSEKFVDFRPCIASYHLHATTEDSSQYAGPSSTDLVGSHRYAVMQGGMSNQIVVTKLEGNKFNIDYYSTVIINGKTKDWIIDLGDYTY